MSKATDWNKRLEPFAKLFGKFYTAVLERLEAMSDEELRQILRDASMPGRTNCGWTTFEAAKWVRYEASSVLLRRENGKPGKPE